MKSDEKPVVRMDLLIPKPAEPQALESIEVGSPEWLDWLAGNSSFVYEGAAGHFTARREIRRGNGYWYGYRRRNGKLSKIYLGKSDELTPDSLEQANATLAGQIPLKRFIGIPKINKGLGGYLRQAGKPKLDGQNPPVTSFLPMIKVSPPVIPDGLVARSDQTQKFKLPVTVISAPGGFGKSTLINEWRLGCGEQVAWVNLEKTDNNPFSFWLCVVKAFQTIDPAFGQEWLPPLQPASTDELSNMVVHITNDLYHLANGISNSHWIGLVLDNYHFIQNSEIHTSLQILLDHIPSKLKLVISGQSTPPLALGYLRSKGMVMELGVEDLQFTPEEGLAYLQNHTRGSQVSYYEMQTLVKRCKGWITGLVLAVAARAQQENKTGFFSAFTGDHPLLREYFEENVLSQVSPPVQMFLVKTSILRHLTGPLCDAVCGRDDSTDVLLRLAEDKLFIDWNEEERCFRYHSLFSEFLRARLQENFPREMLELHRRAAKWFYASDTPAYGIFHSLACEAWDDAARMIGNVAEDELVNKGEDSRILRWLHELPDEIMQAHTDLLSLFIRLKQVAFASSLTSSYLDRFEAAKLTRGDTSQLLSESPTEDKTHMLAMASINEREIEQAILSEQFGSVNEILAEIVYCQRNYRKDVITAENYLRKVFELALQKNHLYGVLVAGGGCANLELSQGHLRRSEQIAHQVLRQASEMQGKLPEPASIALNALSGVYFMRNQLVQAHQLLLRSIEVDANPVSTNELISNAILRAKIQSANSDNAAAFTTINEIREINTQRPSSIWADQDLAAYQELYRLRQGDVSAAERILNETGEVETNAFSALVRAEIFIEQKRPRAAEEQIDRFLQLYPNGAYLLPVMRARLILAIALFDQRNINQARQIMAEATRLAAPEFFVRPFLDYGQKIVSLLSLVLKSENVNSGTQSFIKGVLVMLGQNNSSKILIPRDEPATLAIAASLSSREQEILHLICAGLSNHEISLQCSISVSTVKTHLENIFRKIGVSSRTQAIAQAQALGLVQT